MNQYCVCRARHFLYFAVLLPLLLQGCAYPYNRISPPESVFLDTNVVATTGATSNSGKYVYGAFSAALQKAQATGANPSDYNDLYLQGMGLVDYVCANYFRTLGKASQDLGFTRKETSLAGGLVSAMLGLANQTPKLIANTGAAFGFTTASMDSYQDAYLFSPDVGAVQELVFSAFSTFKTAHPRASSWGDIVSLLPQYEERCQPHGIRRLINASITRQVSGANGGSVDGDNPVTLSATTVKFNNQARGTTSSSQTITYTNAGQQPITVFAVIAPANFAVQSNSCVPGPVAGGSHCDINLTFTPPAANTYQGVVRIFDDTSGAPRSIAVSGTGS